VFISPSYDQNFSHAYVDSCLCNPQVNQEQAQYWRSLAAQVQQAGRYDIAQIASTRAGKVQNDTNMWRRKLQQRYDIAYAQCMAASGNSVQTLPVAWRYTPYGYYPYALSAYYGPWLGPPVAFGLFGGFEPRFNHRVFFHHGFHRGGGAGK
jgi:hypothetical protein